MSGKPESLIPKEYLAELKELCEKTPEGSIVELGVYRGGSACALNEVSRGRPIHLYDTFTGIPEATEVDCFSVGSFRDVDLGAVMEALPNANFHVGFFPATLGEEPKVIAFAHVDCDQYKSCIEAIKGFWPRMVSGGVIAFDDYKFPGIKRAIHEFFKEGQIQFTSLKIPYVKKE